MLSRQQKLEKRKEFIRSDDFTEATWTTLILFNQNVQTMIRLIELEGIWINETQAGTWQGKYTMTDEQRLEVVHMAYVDAISKLMMCIEGLFALMYAVRGAYRKIPRLLTRYQMSQVDVMLKLVADENKAKKSLWRILGYPNLKYLHLDRSERKIVWEVLNQSLEAALKALRIIREFYLDHLVVYGKFKHGLSLLLGMRGEDQARVDSLVYTFDRSDGRPPGYVIEMAQKLRQPFEWFNTLQMVPYGEPMFRVISGILHDVRELVFMIANNHLMWAENCGLDYLPAKREGDKANALVYGGPFTPQLREAYDKIWVRVGENMTLPTRTLQFRFNFKRDAVPEMIDRLAEGRTVTVWVSRSRGRKPYFEQTPTIE